MIDTKTANSQKSPSSSSSLPTQTGDLGNDGKPNSTQTKSAYIYLNRHNSDFSLKRQMSTQEVFKELRKWINSDRRLRINKIYALIQELEKAYPRFAFLDILGEKDSHKLFDAFDRRSVGTKSQHTIFHKKRFIGNLAQAMSERHEWTLTTSEHRIIWINQIQMGKMDKAKQIYELITDPLEIIVPPKKDTRRGIKMTKEEQCARMVYYRAKSFAYWNTLTSTLLAKMASSAISVDSSSSTEALIQIFQTWLLLWEPSLNRLKDQSRITTTTANNNNKNENIYYWNPNPGGRLPFRHRELTIRPYAVNMFLWHLIRRGQIKSAINLYRLFTTQRYGIRPNVATYQILISGLLRCHTNKLLLLKQQQYQNLDKAQTSSNSDDDGDWYGKDSEIFNTIDILCQHMKILGINPNTAFLNSIVSVGIKRNYIQGVLYIIRVFEEEWDIRPNDRTLHILKPLLFGDSCRHQYRRH
ncbi:hypothetical protein H4219_004778 [Mycoemilia scoparia]|uniref:Pentatricopeptide repeat-containing protein n=1 Tax=Mycoemilia scoparia TaxID=417184 RepID=A0A9W7ZWD0_9FUNG|nr:hypothetical protein H4219_004778 [Mycoemilia scoparia]